MKKITIGEFVSYCDKLSPSEFIISTNNQIHDFSESGFSCNLVFPAMIVHTNPSSICFKDKSSYIKLDRIKYIKKRENSLLGCVFNIVCFGFIDTSKEFVYTIIVR